MRLAACVVPLCGAVLLVAAELHPGLPPGLRVHEWGTFTSVAGEDGTAVTWDALGCKSDLPNFVHDFGYRGLKLGLHGSVRMETPVLYFYSSRAMDAQVKVSFPRGLLTEWYPQAEYAAHQIAPADDRPVQLAPRNVAGCTKCHMSLNGIDTSLQNLTGTLEWNRVHIEPGAQPSFPTEEAPNRYYAARGTDAAPLAVGDQHEKFLFYRGVGSFPIPLSARVHESGKIMVANLSGESVPTVILFENRGGHIGYRMAGILEKEETLDAGRLDATFARLRQDLQAALVSQGLYPKEAHAMVETWRDSWFEEGSRLIYLVPRATVDAILPLQVEPAPSEIARVFVGRIELLTPETKRTVEAAVKTGDWQVAARYQRFLTPILDRIFAADPASRNELASRAADLLATHWAEVCK
jgi:hypothetical protein